MAILRLVQSTPRSGSPKRLGVTELAVVDVPPECAARLRRQRIAQRWPALLAAAVAAVVVVAGEVNSAAADAFDAPRVAQASTGDVGHQVAEQGRAAAEPQVGQSELEEELLRRPVGQAAFPETDRDCGLHMLAVL